MTEENKTRKGGKKKSIAKFDQKTDLNDRQEAFCREYLIDLNKTQAAIRAGYSPNTAGQIGDRLLKNVKIQAVIAALQADRGDRMQKSADDVLKKLWELADFQLRQIGTFDGKEIVFKPMSEWTENAHTAIRTLKQTTIETKDREGNVTTKTTIEVKPEPLIPALENLMKHFGMTSDFNTAIATLRTYGIYIKRDADNNWIISSDD